MSPRDFDSDDRTQTPAFVENVDCDRCGTTFEGFFLDTTGSLSFEDMTDPPEGHHICPACGHSWRSQATGWSFYSEAG